MKTEELGQLMKKYCEQYKIPEEYLFVECYDKSRV